MIKKRCKPEHWRRLLRHEGNYSSTLFPFNSTFRLCIKPTLISIKNQIICQFWSWRLRISSFLGEHITCGSCTLCSAQCTHQFEELLWKGSPQNWKFELVRLNLITDIATKMSSKLWEMLYYRLLLDLQKIPKLEARPIIWSGFVLWRWRK